VTVTGPAQQLADMSRSEWGGTPTFTSRRFAGKVKTKYEHAGGCNVAIRPFPLTTLIHLVVSLGWIYSLWVYGAPVWRQVWLAIGGRVNRPTTSKERASG